MTRFYGFSTVGFLRGPRVFPVFCAEFCLSDFPEFQPRACSFACSACGPSYGGRPQKGQESLDE